MAVMKYDDIVGHQPIRINTYIDDLNWIYGSSDIEINGKMMSFSGMPERALSLWGGQAGVGKTRICVELVKRFTPYHGYPKLPSGTLNRKVLYFQLEVGLQQFKQTVGSFNGSENFILADDQDLKSQIDIIHQVQPKLIIVDSVNRIKQYRNGYGTDDIQSRYRLAIQGVTGSHVIFITHLNAEGSIKGGSNLPHMVDGVFNVYREERDGPVIMRSDDKFRFGPSGRWMWFRHEDRGVVDITENWRVHQRKPHNEYPDGKEPYIKGVGSYSELRERIERQSAFEEQQAILNQQNVDDEWRRTHKMQILGDILRAGYGRMKNKYDRRNFLQKFLNINPPD